MLEVEAKVPVKKEDYPGLLKTLHSTAVYLGEKRADDSYYEKLKKGTIRIRRKGGRYSFDLKRRETIRGIESNTEMEWIIKNPQAWRRLLARLEVRPNVRKTKKTELFKMDGFLIELNEIRLLGYYLEIEKLITDASRLDSTKKELIQLFKKLGYSEKEFEPKRYLELLGYV